MYFLSRGFLSGGDIRGVGLAPSHTTEHQGADRPLETVGGKQTATVTMYIYDLD